MPEKDSQQIEQGIFQRHLPVLLPRCHDKRNGHTCATPALGPGKVSQADRPLILRIYMRDDGYARRAARPPASLRPICFGIATTAIIGMLAPPGTSPASGEQPERRPHQ